MNKSVLPDKFNELFPVISFHKDPAIFFLRNGESVGALLKISSPKKEVLEKIGQLLLAYLKKTPMTTEERSLNLSLYRKAQWSESNGNEKVLEFSAILSVTVDHQRKLPKKKNEALIAMMKPKKNQIAENLEALSESVNHILAACQNLSLKVEAVQDVGTAAMLSRYFWRSSADRSPVNVDFREVIDIAKFYTNDFLFVPFRTFWRDGSSLRSLYTMRTPPVNSRGEQSLSSVIKDLTSVQISEAGTLMISLSKGGPIEPNEKRLIYSFDDGSSEGEAIRLSTLYICDRPWSKEIEKNLSSFSARPYLNNLERQTIENLLDVYPGSDWCNSDILWTELWLQTMPGAWSVSDEQRGKIFDLFYFY